MSDVPRTIVIIGGGIIGCTTAYYLTHHPYYSRSNTTVILLEASAAGPAKGASGKAGGLVAKWAYPKELVGLSFAEHVRLAEKYNGAERWGWRYVGCGSWEGRGESAQEYMGSGVGAGGERKSLEKTLGLSGDYKTDYKKKRFDLGMPDDLDWIKADLTFAYTPMAPHGFTGQVHPFLFTTSMLELATDRGAHFITGRAQDIHVDPTTRNVTGVTYQERDTGAVHTIPATHVVLAAGVWSKQLLPALPIEGTRAHSITIRPPVPISPYVLFTEIDLPPGPGTSGTQVSPEVYARPDSEVYCCGPGDNSPVPDTVDDVLVDLAACQSIHDHVSSISGPLREGKIEKRQACFLPVVTGGGGPIVGEAKNIARGLMIATGHTCWASTLPPLFVLSSGRGAARTDPPSCMFTGNL